MLSLKEPLNIEKGYVTMFPIETEALMISQKMKSNQ